MFEDVNAEILRLWDAYSNDQHDLLIPSFFHDPPPTPYITIVGINPSFSEVEAYGRMSNHAATRWWLPDALNGQTARTFCAHHGFRKKIRGISRDFVEEVRFFDKSAQDNHLYFTLPKALAQRAGLAPHFVDLLPVRMTSQKKAEDWAGLNKHQSKKWESTKGKVLVDLFFEMLAASKPNVILIANAQASNLVRTKLGCPRLDQTKGFHWWAGPKGTCPIFFSSQMSGGRLDVGSRERLEWQIKKANAGGRASPA